MAITTLEEFYKETASLIPEDINKEIGHFNVFKIDELMVRSRKTVMPYNRRAYYKISIISGRNRAEYADKVIDIEKNALLFATPKIPYNYIPQDDNQFGYFCIFTSDFLIQNKSGVILDELPIFQVSRFVGLMHYVELWYDQRFWHSVANTLYFAVVSVSLEVLFVVDQFRGALTSTETYERTDEIWWVKGTPLKDVDFERD